MKTAKIKLENIKSSDGWSELAFDLMFEKFEANHSNLDEDVVADKFHDDVLAKKFQYREFANLEIEFDEEFNIVGGKLIPFKS